MRFHKEVTEELTKPTSRLILLEFKKNDVLPLKELQYRLGASVKRSTLFRTLDRLTKKKILDKQKSRTSVYILKKPKLLEKLEPTDEDKLDRIRLDKAANEILASDNVFELSSGIGLADPVGYLKKDDIKEYRKYSIAKPESLLELADKIYLDFTKSAIEKYLEEAKDVVYSINTTAFQGYALGYLISHLRWWYRVNNLDVTECEKVVKSYIKGFDRNIRQFSKEYVKKIGELENKVHEIRERNKGTLYDISDPMTVIRLQEKGRISEEEEFWLLVLEKMAWEFRNCAAILPNKGPYIVVDTHLLKEGLNAS